jgi:hypothetical protein
MRTITRVLALIATPFVLGCGQDMTAPEPKLPLTVKIIDARGTEKGPRVTLFLTTQVTLGSEDVTGDRNTLFTWLTVDAVTGTPSVQPMGSKVGIPIDMPASERILVCVAVQHPRGLEVDNDCVTYYYDDPVGVVGKRDLPRNTATK